jgi:ribosomal protein S18 acetylase RimI-like enzyme
MSLHRIGRIGRDADAAHHLGRIVGQHRERHLEVCCAVIYIGEITDPGDYVRLNIELIGGERGEARVGGVCPRGLSSSRIVPAMPRKDKREVEQISGQAAALEFELRVRRIHRRDLNRVWSFLKLVFRDVGRQTVEYQRPRLKKHFSEIYEEDGVEQLLFELKKGAKHELVGYAEYAYEIVGSDNWMNQRYFENRKMRPLFVQELAVHPDYHGLGVGSFMMEQIEHAARLRGCTHVVLEVAENNEDALRFYRNRNFFKLDAAVFLARKLVVGDELLRPRKIRPRRSEPPKA